METLLCAVSITENIADDVSAQVEQEENPSFTVKHFEYLSPWHQDFTSQSLGLQFSIIRDIVYTFLLSSSLNDLRAMGRETKRNILA